MYSCLRYLACKLLIVCAELYCQLWPLWFYHIFPQYLTIGTNFGKKLLNTKRVFWIPLQNLSETFLILRRIQRAIIINLHRSSLKVPVILVMWATFDKTSNIKFDENPCSGSRIVPCRQTDMTKLKAAFRNFANTHNNNNNNNNNNNESHDTSVRIVIRLWAEKPSKCGTILNEGKRFSCSWNCTCQLCGQHSP
jgi:hypothetical protein